MENKRAMIEVLPDSLINKIAAGEVVERPASVVKELLENAMDAGGTRVRVDIEEGGRRLIRVVDNGSGIPREQAKLAFLQHATSKIKSAEDLFAISTMGFRGEALASIASVSHATLVTRTADGEGEGAREGGAWKIEVKDSVVGELEPCAGPVGTTLEVRDLFYSVPARRKFLRSDATEFGHIHEMVLRSALPNPGISFVLTHNGRVVLDLPATTDHRSRVSGALGVELHEQLVGIDFAEAGGGVGRGGVVSIKGFAGQPALARATAKFQYLFLNGRFIRDRSIFHAMKEAYRGLIEPASQPVAVLFITMDPGAFDVNVHPQKTEVRFRDSGGPYSVVLAAMRESLLGADLTPMMKVGGRIEQGEDGRGMEGAGNTGRMPVPRGATETREIIAEFFKRADVPQPRLAFGVEGGAKIPSPLEDPSRMIPPANPSLNANLPALPRYDDLSAVQSMAASVDSVREMVQKAEDGEDQFRGSEPATRFMQFHNTYIVVQTGEGLVIIDQHALHERIMYEELYNRATRGPLEGQHLLLPEVLAVNPKQQAALELVRPLLTDLGIVVEAFDSQSVAVHSFPSLLSKVSPRDFLRDLLDKLMELGPRLSREELLHEVLDMASCKAAVKAGYVLSEDEIAALLSRREMVERSSNCPHGRPTTLRLTIHDLEKQFKRK